MKGWTRVTPCVAGVALTLLVASPAAATTYYASPTGSGTACTKIAPCEIHQGASTGGPGDELVLLPGSYGSAGMPLHTSIVPHVGLNVHGQAGSPRPTIHASVGTALNMGAGVVSYVHVINTSGSAVRLNAGSTVNRSVMESNEPGDFACGATGGTIENTVCTSTSGAGVFTNCSCTNPIDVTLRNVTAWATGMLSTGLSVQSNAQPVTYHVSNSIMHGDNEDVRAENNGSTPTIDIDHSDFGSLTTLGVTSVTSWSANGNTPAAPQLVDPANGDFRELAPSPTRDTGANAAAVGPTDLAGNARTIGGTVDMGALEFVPAPVATTGGATSKSPIAEAVSGQVNPKGGVTSYRFQFGKTAAYGRVSAAKTTGIGFVPQHVTANLTGLKPSTTYHYRLLAANSGGTSLGADRTFKTPADRFAGITLLGLKVPVKKGKARPRQGCPPGTPGPCAGTDRLTVKRNGKTLVLGSAPFSIGAGKVARVGINLSKSGRGLLKTAGGQLAATLTAVATDAAGTKKKTTTKVTLKVKKK